MWLRQANAIASRVCPVTECFHGGWGRCGLVSAGVRYFGDTVAGC